MTMWPLFLLVLAAAAKDSPDKDGESSRKILGSSVVTSVSVIMDAGNGSKIYSDAVGKPVSKPHAAADLASPIDLLSPDRYEFYTFDDTGDLVKRLMTLEEIHDIIATGDDDLSLDSFALPEKRVNDVVNNVQNVLKEEIKTHKNPERPMFDTPDVSDSWSMILPAVFGNSGDDIHMEKPVKHVTDETILVEEASTAKPPVINVQIVGDLKVTTEKMALNVEQGQFDYGNHVSKSTKQPFTVTTTTTARTTTKTVDTTVVPNMEQGGIENSQDVSRDTTTTIPSTTTTTTTSTTGVSTVPDNLEQASTLFEKIALLETSTVKPVELSTSEQTLKPIDWTTATDAVKDTQTTLFYERISTVELTTSTVKPTEEVTTTLNPVVTVLSTTTEVPTSTEFELRATSTPVVQETTTTVPETTSTFGPLSTFFTILDTISNQTDLDTESTEYRVSTTETQSTDSTSTALDQLLLSSTNIYEINSELSDVKSTTSFEENTTEEKFLIRLSDPTDAPPISTTDQTFIDTIEQLISQAVGTPAPPVEAKFESNIVQQMIMSSTNKTMPVLMAETATVASKLVGGTEETTIPPSTTTITTTPIEDLSDSIGALLSQVVGDGSTTVENELSTTTEVSTTPITTTTTPTTTTTLTTTTITPTTTTTIPTTTTTTPTTTTTIPTTTTTIPTTTTTVSTTTSFVPHIINITIIRNDNYTQAKPAKSDLSLEKEEEDLYNEMRKNGTLHTTTEPIEVTTSLEPQPSLVITINETNTDLEDTKWTLVSTVAPDQPEAPTASSQTSSPVDLVPKPLQGFGLEDSTAKLDTDIYQFVQLCNELAFGFWKSVTTGLSSARSVVVSPFAATSLLAMVFLGARGATSGEMNEILKLDDMVTFNPHLIFKNVSESIESSPDSGVAVSAIVRELFSDRSKGKLLGFYKERVRQFYDGHVEEASFKDIADTIRRRTNLLVKKHTEGKVVEFLRDGSIVAKPPLAGVSVSLFQTDCSQGSTEGRDGELHFVVLPSLRQRRLIPIPATVYRSGFLAGYEPSLDATAAALGTKDQIVSTIFIIPGQQGIAAPGDGLVRLEKRLVESSFKKGAWSRLLRSLIPRPGLELQIPRFQHRSLINATESLKRMGLHELFDARKADLKGLNGAAHDLHLSDVTQINEFATCGEQRIGEAHHVEVYPATTERRSRLVLQEWEEPRDYQRAFHDPLHDPNYLTLPLALRPRQARLPEVPRLRFDRPFLFFVRHNPSGLILHMGRFHPRLLP